MSYSSACFSTADVIQVNMQQIEDNFDALRNNFGSSSAPSSPQSGQFWYDSGTSFLKIRQNSSWVSVIDMGNQRAAAGFVKTDSLMASILSTDSTGRGKMANGYITNAHVNDVDASKITSLPRAGVIYSIHSGTVVPLSTYADGGTSALTMSLGRVFIPNSGAYKLYMSYFGKVNGGNIQFTLTVGTSAVSMGTLTSTAEYLDSVSYIDVTAFAGSLRTVSLASTATGGVAGAWTYGMILYLTT